MSSPTAIPTSAAGSPRRLGATCQATGQASGFYEHTCVTPQAPTQLTQNSSGLAEKSGRTGRGNMTRATVFPESAHAMHATRWRPPPMLARVWKPRLVKVFPAPAAPTSSQSGCNGIMDQRDAACTRVQGYRLQLIL